MAGRKIEVVSYSGYKGEEYPRSFVIDGKKIEVIEIMRMWIEEGLFIPSLQLSLQLTGETLSRGVPSGHKQHPSSW